MADTNVKKAVAQRIAVAGVREATKNIGKQVVKAHVRATGKVVSSYLRVAPRGAARFIPGGIGLTISLLDAAYSAYSLYGVVNDKPEEPQEEIVEDMENLDDESDDDAVGVAFEGANAELPALFM